jgi:hypothetical protein
MFLRLQPVTTFEVSCGHNVKSTQACMKTRVACVISHKIELFITTGVRTSNPAIHNTVCVGKFQFRATPYDETGQKRNPWNSLSDWIIQSRI